MQGNCGLKSQRCLCLHKIALKESEHDRAVCTILAICCNIGNIVKLLQNTNFCFQLEIRRETDSGKDEPLHAAH